MLSRSVRIALFVLGAFAILGLTAGVTQAANRLLSGGDGNARYAAAQVRTAKELSLKARASAALGANLNTGQAKMNSGTLQKSVPAPVEKVEFSGVITAVEMGLWTIGNFQVQVNAATEVEGDPVLGETVEVEAFVLEDGTLVAHEIERVSDPVDDTGVDDDKDDADDDQSDDQSDSGDDDGDHDEDDDDDDDGDHDDDDDEEDEDEEKGGGEHESKP